jgi:hypothetical protein
MCYNCMHQTYYFSLLYMLPLLFFSPWDAFYISWHSLELDCSSNTKTVARCLTRSSWTVLPTPPIYDMHFLCLYYTTCAHISALWCAPLQPFDHAFTLCITTPTVHASLPLWYVYYHTSCTHLDSISTGQSPPVFHRLNFLSNQVVLFFLAHEYCLQRLHS